MTDRGWIENEVSAFQRDHSCGFGEPLVVTDEDGEIQMACFEDAVTGVPQFEITLFIEKRVVRDVNLSVGAQQRSICIDDGGRIVELAFLVDLEHRSNNNHVQLLRDFSNALCRFAWNGLREMCDIDLFVGWEIFTAIQFLQTNHLSAQLRSLLDAGERGADVLLHVMRNAGLDETNSND